MQLKSLVLGCTGAFAASSEEKPVRDGVRNGRRLAYNNPSFAPADHALEDGLKLFAGVELKKKC